MTGKGLYRFLFGIAPAIGSVWRLRGSDPFQTWTVTVIDVKDGWEQHRFGSGGLSSLSNRSFHFCYREVTDALAPI